MVERARKDVPYLPKDLELYKDGLREEEREPSVTVKEKIYRPEIEIVEDVHRSNVTSLTKKLMKDMQGAEMKPLQTLGSDVTGILFDRVKFLKERMDETAAAIADKEAMNKRFNGEIDEDIEDMQSLITSISDREQLRDFKLNVTLLRMEKRKEDNQHWRDMVELRSQLQELHEQHETELRISNLFKDLTD